MYFKTFLYYFRYLKQTYSFWSSRGVPGPKPLPLIGNMHNLFSDSRGEGDQARARKYGRIYGYFMGMNPVLLVTDARLVKQILVRDFHQLLNRQKQKVHHPVWEQNLFNAEDEQWRHLRTITSPAFTSGKLRAMHSLMDRGIQKLTTYLDSVLETSSTDGAVLKDVKETVAGFTIDVIASSGFATETNCNEEVRAGKKSPFVHFGQKLFWVNPFRAMAIIFLPEWILGLLNVQTFIDPTAMQWFSDLAREMVNKRKQSGEKRPDLVQLLLDAKVEESELAKVNFDQLTADADVKGLMMFNF